MNAWNFMIYILFIVGGFLSGSIMYCRIVPKLFLKKDICELSKDRNPGAANVFSNCGAGWGMFCLFLDLMKGFIPVFLACCFLNTDNFLFALILAAPVLGHAIAPLNNYHGGKCIATAFGVMLALSPFNQIGVILAAVYILACVFIKNRSNRIRSICAFTVFGISALLTEITYSHYAIGAGCLIIAATAVLKHTKHYKLEGFRIRHTV